MGLCAEQHLIVREQRFVYCDYVVNVVFNKILYYNVKLVAVRQGIACFHQQLGGFGERQTERYRKATAVGFDGL